MRKLFKKQFLPILLLVALLGNIIIPNMMPTGMVYAAEEKPEALMEAAVMSAGSEVVLGNDSIMINGIKYLNSELKSLLSKATITRLDFNPAMAQRMIDFAKAAGMIITPTALKTIGVAVAGVFLTMALILALSALAYYAYQVVMEDGNIFNLSFLPDSVFIGNTQITGFTKSIAEMTNFFETRMKENPNEEVAKPEGGTDTGEAEKPGEGDGETKPEVKYPGDDPTKAPGEGWEWRGSGDPSSGKGNWYNPKTGETLHPDLNHPEGIDPHWDYKDTGGKWWRVFEDGRIEAK